MTREERQFFHDLARAYTGVATMATALAVDCQTSGHGQAASPAKVETALWPYLDALHASGTGLRAKREAIRPK